MHKIDELVKLLSQKEIAAVKTMLLTAAEGATTETQEETPREFINAIRNIDTNPRLFLRVAQEFRTPVIHTLEKIIKDRNQHEDKDEPESKQGQTTPREHQLPSVSQAQPQPAA